METPLIPDFLQLTTNKLLDQFGAGGHKPGSGTAAALLGLVGCKMMQTVILATRRNLRYSANIAQLDFVSSVILQQHEPFFRDAVQRDSMLFDSYYHARIKAKECVDESEKRRLTESAREELMKATEMPLEIARHAADAAQKGLDVYDLGAAHVRGDSGLAISAALSSCSGALFIVYLNLLKFREGRWAITTRADADSVKLQYQFLQSEQFRRVSRIQAEGIDDFQIGLQLGLEFEDENPNGV